MTKASTANFPMGSPTDANAVHPVGRAELPRVLPAKTEFWHMYEGFAREEDLR